MKCCELHSAVWHAIYSGYLSVTGGIIELSLSIMTGQREDSMSLFGLSIMAVAEIIGSILVIWRWQFANRQNLKESIILRNEMIYAIVIGAVILILGVALVICSAIKLFLRPPPLGSFKGILVSVFGASASFTLYAYKIIIGKQLNSVVILADARCSFCVAMISLCALLAQSAEPYYDWADGVMGMLVATFTIIQGYWQIKESLSKLKITNSASVENLTTSEKAHLLRTGEAVITVDRGPKSEELGFICGNRVRHNSTDSLRSDATDALSLCSEIIDDDNITVTI